MTKIFLALALLLGTVACSSPEHEWSSDYQDDWMAGCQFILHEWAALSGITSKDLCRCTLNGLMEHWDQARYMAWDQDTKDGAASPYVAECWESLIKTNRFATF